MQDDPGSPTTTTTTLAETRELGPDGLSVHFSDTISDKKCNDSIAMGEDARSDAAHSEDARSFASAGRASRAWSMNESVAEGDEHELATIRVRTMYGCVFAVPLPRRHCETRTPVPAKISLQVQDNTIHTYT